MKIRTHTATFRDPRKWNGDKEYHWFFKAGEREFKITDKDQLEINAMELIEQSYDLSSVRRPSRSQTPSACAFGPGPPEL